MKNRISLEYFAMYTMQCDMTLLMEIGEAYRPLPWGEVYVCSTYVCIDLQLITKNN